MTDVYYKIKMKAVDKAYDGSSQSWIDDLNTPPAKGKKGTKHYKTLAEAKKAYNKNTWGLRHIKRIVKVSGGKSDTIYQSDRVFNK
jgi:hypothetical protein